MATLGLGEVAFLLAKDLTEITGGVSGIPGIPHPSGSVMGDWIDGYRLPTFNPIRRIQQNQFA
jgi:ABC-type branched-subunit amino acid transport system permease subunit